LFWPPFGALAAFSTLALRQLLISFEASAVGFDDDARAKRRTCLLFLQPLLLLLLFKRA